MTVTTQDLFPRILKARVYDLAVETPLDPAVKLGKRGIVLVPEIRNIPIQTAGETQFGGVIDSYQPVTARRRIEVGAAPID